MGEYRIRTAQEALPMQKPIFGRFLIHVDGPTLDQNKQDGGFRQVVIVRKGTHDAIEDKIFCREVMFDCPTRVVHRPGMTIPGTKGRGVSWIECDGPITMIRDNAEPLIISYDEPAPQDIKS